MSVLASELVGTMTKLGAGVWASSLGVSVSSCGLMSARVAILHVLNNFNFVFQYVTLDLCMHGFLPRPASEINPFNP